MRRLAIRSALLVMGLGSGLGGCVGKAGGETLAFPVAAAGPADAVAGQPLAFTANGFDVALTHARLHVGALYLGESAPVSGGQATGCYQSTTYVVEETSALDVDLLDPAAQPFPGPGRGITEPAPLVGEVWLTGGDVNAASDSTAILELTGQTTQSGATLPFTATVTIGANRVSPTAGAAGGAPICKQRIVSPIPARLALAFTGGLLLRVDPRRFFETVDFATLPVDPASGGRVFPDDNGTAPSAQLFDDLHSIAPYTFTWSDAL